MNGTRPHNTVRIARPHAVVVLAFTVRHATPARELIAHANNAQITGDGEKHDCNRMPYVHYRLRLRIFLREFRDLSGQGQKPQEKGTSAPAQQTGFAPYRLAFASASVG